MTSNPDSVIEPLRQALGQFQAALTVVDDAIAIFSVENKLLWCNKAYEDFTGSSRMMLLGLDVDKWIQSSGLDEDSQEAVHLLASQVPEQSFDVEPHVFQRQHRGLECTFMIEAHEAKYKADQKTLVLVIKNITDKYKALDLQRQTYLLEKEAERCPLTGLLNRRGLMKKIDYILSEGMKDGFALIFCDVNKFKFVNDTYGHDVGDQVLLRLSSVLRQTIRGGDFVGRLAGDEFLIGLVNKPGKVESVSRKVAERILKSLDRKYPFRRGQENLDLEITMSLGIAQASNVQGVDSLLRNADLAMYQAKTTNCGYYFFDEKLRNQDRINTFIREASDSHRNQGVLPYHLQPIVSTVSNLTVGYEVLMRPISANGVLIPVDQFIRYHEDKNSMETVDRLLISSFLATFQQDLLENDQFVAINLNALSLCSDRFVDFLIESLRVSWLPFESVIIEITETAFIQSQARLHHAVELISAQGIRVFLDDFGVGQTGLIQLVNLPIHGFKIDSTLFEQSKINNKARSLLCSFRLFAEQLKMMLIVEGIESDQDIDHLSEMRFDYAQGYKFGMPLPQENIIGKKNLPSFTLSCPTNPDLDDPLRSAFKQ